MNVALCAVMVGPFTACGGGSCKEYAAFGLFVKVVDSSGVPVCDAAVTATDHAFSELLRPNTLADGTCGFSGVVERKGTYAVSVRASGHTQSGPVVKISANDCHVIPINLTVTMQP